MSKGANRTSESLDAFESIRVSLEAAKREHDTWFHSNGEGNGYCYLWGADCNGVDLRLWTKLWRKITGRETRSRDAAQFLAFMLCRAKAADSRGNSPSKETKKT